MNSILLSSIYKKINLNNFTRIFNNGCRLYAKEAPYIPPDEYTEKPEYPEILDVSEAAVKRRKFYAEHEELKNVTTIEGKILKINMPRYYGWKSYFLGDKFNYPYDCLPYIQHYTRTLIKEGIPAEYYKISTETEDKLVAEIRGLIEDSIVFQHQGYRQELDKIDDPVEKDRQRSLKICKDINRVLLNALSSSVTHLSEIEFDVTPRHEAFWFVGGIEPPKPKKMNSWENWDSYKLPKVDPFDRGFQYAAKPLLTIRNRQPLEPLPEITDEDITDAKKVPKFTYDPKALDIPNGMEHARTIPGFWPGSQHQFGQLSYHDRSHFFSRDPEFAGEDVQETLHSQAIIASYAWLYGQACYQGFSTYNDVTYPLVTQTIITNGQLWSFYLYQLNTTAMHIYAVDENPKVNQCWATQELKLYDEIDENGTVIGLNDEVIRHLIRFYTNAPKKRDHEMKPYLGEHEQTVADIEELKRKEFLEGRFKYIMSNRPRHRLMPEIYNWERIYKIDNETMPIEPRRRFFEMPGVKQPYDRRLDEHRPKYIPKSMRPGGPKSRDRYEPSYWP